MKIWIKDQKKKNPQKKEHFKKPWRHKTDFLQEVYSNWVFLIEQEFTRWRKVVGLADLCLFRLLGFHDEDTMRSRTTVYFVLHKNVTVLL